MNNMKEINQPQNVNSVKHTVVGASLIIIVIIITSFFGG